MLKSFDVIVVGAGHAGVEAALASARLGSKTLLVTSNLDRIAYMSCNPAIGGLAKGHMVREIDVLGGEMGRAADETCIQFKRLNSRKGPAVRGSRAQCDKDRYNQYMSKTIHSQRNLEVLGAEIKSLILEGSLCRGVVTGDGVSIPAAAVVITTGTFMNGVMHVGLTQTEGGRVGDRATIGLSDQLRDFGFVVRRLKTGTPPRLLNSSIDWSKTEPQYGDKVFYPFSFRSESRPKLPQVACYMSYTNEKTHEVIRKNLSKSPMYCGVIEGTGPRYCPSIEDKVVRFAEKIRHQTFLEPEGLDTDLIYLQGISTSLPEDVQYEFLRTIPGLENVKVVRPGYAIEYDYVEPTQIKHSFETRAIESLFLAGQINGTSGYEEAAAQGFLAGVNASFKVEERTPFILSRSEAYMGVLIDDLITKGTREPYRMFTSRAEHRLVLREDNTLDRLFSRSQELGIVETEYQDIMRNNIEMRGVLSNKLKSTILFPNAPTLRMLDEINTPHIINPTSLEILLRRTEVDFWDLQQLGFDTNYPPEIVEPVEIQIKYSGYIDRQHEVIRQMQKLEELLIPEAFDFSKVVGLSREEVEKLMTVRPRTLAQAGRISGVNPTAVQALLMVFKSLQRRERTL